jgi:hypothetical protein
MTKEAIAKAPAGRPNRTPIGKRNVLTVQGKEAGFEYRFVNDSGDRVQEFLDNGWEIVTSKSVRVGDKRTGTTSAEGTPAKASVGGGLQAYVLRIRSDWHAEDQAAKQALVDKTEEATRQEALDGTYGKLEIARS